MAKNVSYRGKKEIDPAEGKIPYDPALWQAREGGDYIHTLTGEIRQEEGFNFEATTTEEGEAGGAADDDGSYSSTNEWEEIITDVVTEGDALDDISQDALGDDFVAAQVKISTPSSGDAPEGETAGGKSKTVSKGKGKKR